MMNKKKALVTGGTKKDVDAMAVLVLNIKETNADFIDEIVIFHDGIPQKTQKKINEIFPTKFVRYKCPISKFELYQNKSVRYFSPMIFCKYELLTLLNDYERVIWTDYDVVFLKSVNELQDISTDAGFIVNHDTKLKEMFFKEKLNLVDSNVILEGACICTPLVVLRDTIKNADELRNWCYKMTKKYIKAIYLPEQCIYTMLFQAFPISYMELDMDTYCLHPREKKDWTKIIHAYGQPKFWSGLENEVWNKYYSKWLEIKCSK